MKTLILVLFSLTMACTAATSADDTCPVKSKTTMLFSLPVPVSRARICFPFKDTGANICVPLDNPKVDTFIITGTAK